MRQIVYGLAAVWLVLFLLSFVLMQLAEPSGSGFTRGLNRIASFLSWQSAAFVAAMVLAWLTRRAVDRGVANVKLVGYLPLAVSVFLVVSVIAIIAYRVFVAPLLPSA